jgi:hypothetical protein
MGQRGLCDSPGNGKARNNETSLRQLTPGANRRESAPASGSVRRYILFPSEIITCQYYVDPVLCNESPTSLTFFLKVSVDQFSLSFYTLINNRQSTGGSGADISLLSWEKSLAIKTWSLPLT